MKAKVKRDIYIIVNFTAIVLLAILYGRYEEAKKHTTIILPIPKIYATEASEPTPTPPPQAVGSEREKAIDAIKRVWKHHANIGIAIASCESGLRAKAINRANRDGSVDVGLFQINSIHGFSEAELLDPITNASLAYVLFLRSHLSPWRASEKCWRSKI